MQAKGFSRLTDFIGRTVSSVGDWAELDLGYRVVAEIEQSKCINCGLCYIACEDGAHQSIKKTPIPETEWMASTDGRTALISGGNQVMAGAGAGYVNQYEIKEESCVGCNLCSLVCPVDGCISMVEMASSVPSMTWSEYQRRLTSGEMEKIKPPDHV